MRCCNNITERLTGIALPLLNVTAEWNCVTSVAKCWHCLASPTAAAAGEVCRSSLCLFLAVFFTDRELWISSSDSVASFRSKAQMYQSLQ